MTARAVHWFEGMFLRPHHFQASHRHVTEQSRRDHKWDLHYNWGLRSLELDLKALANHRLIIHSLEARMRDGTAIVVPKDKPLPAVDLRPAFQQTDKRRLLVYLAIPVMYLGQRNGSLEAEPLVRYFEQLAEFEDENSGGNPQPIPTRIMNLQILVGDQDQAGYEVLPIARLEKSAEAEAEPQLDISYIPPLLSCDAWDPLDELILRAVYERIDKKIDWLTQQVSARGITFDHQAPGELLLLKQLQRLNEAHSVLALMTFTQGVHPLWAFLELSRIVGQLAIFGATRRAPDLPQYNHDDLGTCFSYLKNCIDLELDILVEPEYKERTFIGAGFRMQVALEPAWLEPSWEMYIGVRSSVDSDECRSLLTRAGQLDMKIGSSDRVENLFRQGSGGLGFTQVLVPPQALPSASGLVYFKVQRDRKDEEWQHVQKTLSLAIRLNENLIAGSIHNQRRLTVKAGIKNVIMQFSLFMLPEKV